MAYYLEVHVNRNYSRGKNYVFYTVEYSKVGGYYITAREAHDAILRMYENVKTIEIQELRRQIKELYKSIKK